MNNKIYLDLLNKIIEEIEKIYIELLIEKEKNIEIIKKLQEDLNLFKQKQNQGISWKLKEIDTIKKMIVKKQKILDLIVENLKKKKKIYINLINEKIEEIEQEYSELINKKNKLEQED